jgi:hypothetical protein
MSGGGYRPVLRRRDARLLFGVADVKLGIGADGYGLLLAGEGVGGVLAALIVNRIAAAPRLGTIILAGMALYCLPTALLTVVHEPAIAIPFLQLLRGGGTLVVDGMAVTAPTRSSSRSPPVADRHAGRGRAHPARPHAPVAAADARRARMRLLATVLFNRGIARLLLAWAAASLGSWAFSIVLSLRWRSS